MPAGNCLILAMEVSGLRKIILNRFSSSYNPPTFTCSKSTIETLEKGVKYAQSKQ